MANVFGTMFSLKLNPINLLAIPERQLALHTSGLVPNAPILSGRGRQVVTAQLKNRGLVFPVQLGPGNCQGGHSHWPCPAVSHPSSCQGAWKELETVIFLSH